MAKYTYDFKHKIERETETERQRYREREQNLAKQFTLHSAEAYSEPFPTSKLGGYLTGGKYFHKNIHLRCFIYLFECGKCGKDGKKLQKNEYLEKKKSFLNKTKSIFQCFSGLSFGEKIKNTGHRF